MTSFSNPKLNGLSSGGFEKASGLRKSRFGCHDVTSDWRDLSPNRGCIYATMGNKVLKEYHFRNHRMVASEFPNAISEKNRNYGVRIFLEKTSTELDKHNFKKFLNKSPFVEKLFGRSRKKHFLPTSNVFLNFRSGNTEN